MNSRKITSRGILDIYMRVYPSFTKEKTILKHLDMLKALSECNSEQDYTYNLSKVIQQLKYYDYVAIDDSFKNDRQLIIDVLSNIFNLKDLGDVLNNYKQE